MWGGRKTFDAKSLPDSACGPAAFHVLRARGDAFGLIVNLEEGSLMKTRSAVLRGTGAALPYAQSRPLRIETVELDPPAHGEVRVKIAAAGLCHSDLSVINGDRPRPLPMAIGHEAAGVVEELGPGVDDLRVGDHVVMVFVPSCGHCLPCAEGRPALCEPAAVANGAGSLLGGGYRIRCGSERIHHQLGCSAFSEHTVVSRRSLVKVDPDLPLAQAALFGCAVLTGVGAVVNTARVQAGSSAAVVGLGGVGLAAVLGARVAGARQIVAVDLSAPKRRLALELGATHVFDAGDPDCVQQVRAVSGGGLDYVFEMAGSVRALESACLMTRRGGTTVTSGLPPSTSLLSLSPVSLVAEERCLRGSYIGTCVPARDIPRYVSLYLQGMLPVNKLMSGTITLDEINEGFDRLHAGEVTRLVVRM